MCGRTLRHPHRFRSTGTALIVESGKTLPSASPGTSAVKVGRRTPVSHQRFRWIVLSRLQAGLEWDEGSIPRCLRAGSPGPAVNSGAVRTSRTGGQSKGHRYQSREAGQSEPGNRHGRPFCPEAVRLAAGLEMIKAEIGGLRKRFGRGPAGCRFLILRINHQASSQAFAFTLRVQVGLLPQSKMDDAPLA